MGKSLVSCFFETQCRCKAKPDCSPPGYSSNRLLIIVNLLLNWFGSPASIESGTLFAGTLHSNCHFLSFAGGAALANVMRTTRCGLEVDYAHKIGCHGNVPRGMEKSNFSSFIYGQSSTNPANLVKIGPVDVDIIGLIKITKICIKITAKHTPCSPGLRAERVS